jgi:hypothetical protein
MTAIGFDRHAATDSRIVSRRLVEGDQRYRTDRTTARAAELTARGMSWSGTARGVAEVAPLVVSTARSDAAAGRAGSGP